MQARHSKTSTQDAHMYQLVSPPLQNELSSHSRKLVLGQARLHRATYGGLHTRILPMYTSNHKRRVPHDMLLQTNIALVTLQSQADGKYKIQQEYLGFVEDRMDVVGQTIIDSY